MPAPISIARTSAAGRHHRLFDSVVIISPFFWNFRDDMWQTTHNVAIQLARHAPTIHVEPPAPWNATSEQFRVSRLVTGLFGRRTRRAKPDLTVFRRRALPFGRSERVRALDLRRNVSALRAELARRGLTRPLLWHSFPYWSEFWIDEIPHALLAYHCLDYSPREEETRIIRRADVAFCVSETLVDKHRQVNPNTHLLPNGVDLDLFSRERASRAGRPADLPGDRPIIGFVGSLNCHVDFELVEQIARRRPDACVALVGRILTNETAPRAEQATALQRLRALPNVRLLGFKPSDELALYMNAFDVCLIPFLANSFNGECDPLKFYQYLAFGRPVVSTADIPVSQRYRDICYPAASHAEFLRQVDAALAESPEAEARRRRLEVARAHSWSALVDGAVQRILAAESRHSKNGTRRA